MTPSVFFWVNTAASNTEVCLTIDVRDRMQQAMNKTLWHFPKKDLVLQAVWDQVNSFVTCTIHPENVLRL